MTTILLIFAIVLGIGKNAYDKKNEASAVKSKKTAREDLTATS